MITVSIKKIFSLSLSVLLMLSLFACDRTDNNDIPFEIIDGEQQEENVISEYRVIVSADSSAQLYSLAHSFSEQIKSITGVNSTVSYDNEQISNDASICEILLGDVDRIEVTSLTDGLKSGDYICKVKNGSVIIAGRTDSATAAALERFCAEILPTATNKLLMNPDGGFEFFGKYDIEAAYINGFELSEYTILYSESFAECFSVARDMSDFIRQTSGYCLDVKAEKDFDGVGKRILIGSVAENILPLHTYIIPDSKGLIIGSDSTWGVSVAALNVCDSLFDRSAQNENTVCSLNMTETEIAVYNDGMVDIASVLAEHLLPFNNIKDLTKFTDPIIKDGAINADAVFSGSMIASNRDYVTQSISKYGYSYEGQALSTGMSLPVYDSDDILELFVPNKEICDLSASVYKIRSIDSKDDKNDIFLLVYVTGVVKEDCEIFLDDIVQSSLPILVMTHVVEDGGCLKVSSNNDKGIRLAFNDRFNVENKKYSFACYTVRSVLRVSITEQNDIGGYREISVGYISAFDRLSYQ